MLAYVTEKRSARTTIAEVDEAIFNDGDHAISDEYRVSKPRFPLAYQPTEASLYVTDLCNLACCYCYIVPFSESTAKNQLSTDEWKHVIRELYANGVRTLKFIGGEPLLRVDLADLISFADEIGFEGLELTSNGTIGRIQTNPEALHALRAAKAHTMVSVSLDSPEEAGNNELRGGFAAVVQGISFLIKTGFNVSVAAVITKNNYTQLDELASLAHSLGVAVFQFNNLVPIFEGQKDLVVTSKDVVNGICAEISRLADHYEKRMTIVNRYVPAPNIKPDLFAKHKGNDAVARSSLSGCPASTREVYVLPDGKLISCPMFIRFKDQHSSLSLKNSSFEEIWENDDKINEFRSYLTGPRTHGTCASCSANAICKGGCRAMTFFMKNTLDAQDPRCLF